MAANWRQVVEPFSTLIQTIRLNTPIISGSDSTSVRLRVASSSSSPGENVSRTVRVWCSVLTNNNDYEHGRLGLCCSDGFSHPTVKPLHDI